MDKFIFLVDLVILDVYDKVEVCLILERPFLTTSQTLIDVKDSWILLRVGEEETMFKLQDSMDFDDTCYYVDVVNNLVYNFM